MSTWIRGRLARPIASTLAVALLVSLLLPLTAPPAHAQLPEVLKMLEKGIQTPTTIVVLEGNNTSGYKTGMLGRTFSDALAIEMQRTGEFEVVKRADLDKVMDEYNLTNPLDPYAQSLVADRLKSPFTISSTVEAVEVHKSRDGTYAEVLVRSEVVSKITKTRINGAMVRQKSSPKIGYSGNTDVLVHEALATAAYNVSRTLMDNRLPIGTILTSPRTGEVLIKGGSAIGFRKGMLCVTVRRETVTGRMRLSQVNPTDSVGAILEESKGIAPGDKAVPIFEFDAVGRPTDEMRNATGVRIAGLVGLVLLAAFIGHDGGDAPLSKSPTPDVYSLADATFMEQPFGGNLITWPNRGGKVLAYIIYRDVDTVAPIAVVDGNTYHFIDSATPLPQVGQLIETTNVNITIDPQVGNVTAYTTEPTFDENLDDLNLPNLEIDDESFTVDCRRMPLREGEHVGYMVQTLFLGYEDTGLEGEIGHPENYRLILGQKSPVSNRVTLLKPPTLTSPVDGFYPQDGNYRCQRVAGATAYKLQLSTTSTFDPDPTKTIWVDAHMEGDQYAVATESLDAIYDPTNPLSSAAGRDIFWRFAVRVDGERTPTSWSNPAHNGWVYSNANRYTLPELPPRLRRQRTRGGVMLPGLPTKTPESLRNNTGRGALRR